MLDDATDGGGQQLACPQSPKNGRTAQTPPKSANDRQTGHSAPSGHFCDDASQGRHRRHVPSMSTVAAIALIGVGEFFAAPASRAVADEIFDQMAGAIAAYDASSKTCYYEDAVGPALNKLDQYLSTYRKMGWQAAKSQGGGALEPLKSMGSMLGGTECQSYGLLVGAGLASGIAVIGFDPAVIEAMDRLFAKSGGRALERAESQVPPVSSGAALGPTLNDARAEETVYNCTISVGLNSYSPHQCSFAAEEGKIRIGWPGAETRRLWLDLHVSPPRPRRRGNMERRGREIGSRHRPWAGNIFERLLGEYRRPDMLRARQPLQSSRRRQAIGLLRRYASDTNKTSCNRHRKWSCRTIPRLR